MAVLKIHVIRQRLDKRVAYVQNTEKTACSGFHSLHGIKDTLTSAFNCSCEVAYTQMLETKRHFKKTDKVQGFHFIQSFKPGEVTPEQAHQLGCEFIERCFANDYEVVIGTHTDRAHIHNHIIVNSVSFVDGHKYQSTPATFYELRGISDEICKAHGLSVIQNPSVKAGMHYAEWRAEKENRPTLRSMIREDIDVILAQARTMDDFWDMLRGRGYEIRLNEKRKYVTIRHPNGERFIRLKSLGEDYTPRQLAARIAAQRGHVVQNIQRIQMQQQKLGQRKKYYPMPHTAAPQKRKKLHGFRALYWRYLYMLGKVKKRKAPRKVRGEIMSELKKLDRYTKQYYFLRDHQLSTRNDVALYADAVADEIDILTDRRARLYADRCRPETDHAALQTETKQLTAELRRLRKEQRLCNVIQNTAPAMAAKCEYLNDLSDYNGVVFATGTPISNSMSELYTMMRYLQYDVLEQTGMTDFDSWASSFGETVTSMELSPEGTGYRAKTRFAKFVNLPELMNLWKQAADIQTADMLNLDRPDVEYHNEIAQPTREQKDMVQQLGKRADAVRAGAVDPYTDNMLAITNDGRKLALDQRLADPALPDVPESKLNMVVQNVFDIWEKTKAEKSTQLIFCDLATPSGRGQRKNSFCAYDDIRDKLIARGVPADEIAYIHDADTATKKAAVRNKMNAGTIRILLGSTAKMGAGFNVQTRLIAEHEVDCPWRPRDVEQREGRILRQGNTNSKVDIYRYATEGTFDSYNWQTVENKQKFIAQVMTSKNPARTCEDVDDAALSYAEIKALAAGDPKIKERMELEVDVNKLSVLRSAYKNDHYRLQDDINVNLPHEIAKKENLLTALQHDSATFAANHAQSVGDTFRAEISGHTFTSKEDAGQALIDRIHTEAEKIMSGADDALAWSDSIQIGSYCGFDVRLTRDALKNMALWVQGKTKREVEIGNTPQGMMQRLGNALASFEPNISSCEQSIMRLKEQLASAKEEVDKPWPQEDEYQLKAARLNELNFLLSKKDDQLQLDLKNAQPEVVQ